MKKLILLIVLISCLTQGQDITGKWNGILSVQGMELRLVFHISRKDSTYDAKMDTRDQKAFGIPARVEEFPDMNHLFQTCKTGVMDECATIDQTIDPLVLEEISVWELKQTK